MLTFIQCESILPSLVKNESEAVLQTHTAGATYTSNVKSNPDTVICAS